MTVTLAREVDLAYEVRCWLEQQGGEQIKCLLQLRGCSAGHAVVAGALLAVALDSEVDLLMREQFQSLLHVFGCSSNCHSCSLCQVAGTFELYYWIHQPTLLHSQFRIIP